MASEYTSMLLQMPDCSLPQSPDAAMADDLSHTARFLASPPQYEAASEEPYRTGTGNAHMNVPGAHPELPGPGLKACSKCKLAKPLVNYFKDKSKPDCLYSQCKECATSEERRRREERAPLAAQRAKHGKMCTRCRTVKGLEQFCRNSRSFDGRYSQCRTCVANKDKDRRQKLVERRDEPAEAKVCSRCHVDKHNSEFYRDASKPDGLQTYCKQCLCDKNKTTRKKRSKTGHEDLAGSVAFADGAHAPVASSMSAAMAEPAPGSLSTSQVHCSYSLQDETVEGQDSYGADGGFSAAPQQDYNLQTQDQRQPGYTGEQPGGEGAGEKSADACLHVQADHSSPGHDCSFHQDQGVSHFINSPDYPAPLAGPFEIAQGYPVQQGHDDRHAQAHDAEQLESNSAAYQQQDSFNEQEVYQAEMQYLPSGYDMAGDPAQREKHAESSEPLGYLNSEIQEHRNRLAATMLV